MQLVLPLRITLPCRIPWILFKYPTPIKLFPEQQIPHPKVVIEFRSPPKIVLKLTDEVFFVPPPIKEKLQKFSLWDPFNIVEKQA